MRPLLGCSEERLTAGVTLADPRLKARCSVFGGAFEFRIPLLQEISLLIGVIEGHVEFGGRNIEPRLMEYESLLELIDSGVGEAGHPFC